MAKSADFIARAVVRNLLHLNEGKAYTLLKELANQGVLELVNKGRYSKCRLKGK